MISIDHQTVPDQVSSPLTSKAVVLVVTVSVMLLGLQGLVTRAVRPVPDGSAEHPLVSGTIELVLFEGNAAFRGVPSAEHPAEPVRDLWLRKHHHVEFVVTSQDYVYAVQQPELNLKVVAVPGLSMPLRVAGVDPGHYELTLNPICGTPWKHLDPPASFDISPR